MKRDTQNKFVKSRNMA